MEYYQRPRTLSIVLAGGEGKRLQPLTLDRAKPAVPFAGHYRLIDFALSNLANGGYRKIVVLTQYKSHSLDVHISRTWRMSTMLGAYVTSVPAQMRRGPRWFTGSADAIFQNLNIIEDEDPDFVFVFGADHIYWMDPRQFLDQHMATGAGVTVAAIRVPIEQADQFGIIDPGAETKISDFREKPTEVAGMPEDPSMVLASMGNYIFNRSALEEVIKTDAEDKGSKHDVGGNLIPAMVKAGEAHFYDFTTNLVPGAEHDPAYWRDVGTLDSYYDAHMDLVAPEPHFNIYNRTWPVHTLGRDLPPTKFVRDNGRGCEVTDSMVCRGVIVSGGTVHNSVISPGVRIAAGAVVENSIVMDDSIIGADAVVRNAIVDKNVELAPGAQLGVDADHDAERFTVSDCGIVAVAKGTKIA
ncbi:MAG: glucose-1-phosphate adenylyltransferase [Acidimicrobiales bacterium]